jgi:hypothetical protein
MYSSSRTYTAPAGWIILDYDIQYDGVPTETHEVHLSDGGNYASTNFIYDAYNNAMNFAGRAGQYNLRASFHQRMQNLLSMASMAQSNRGALSLTIRAATRGIFQVSRPVIARPRMHLLCVGTESQIINMINGAMIELEREAQRQAERERAERERAERERAERERAERERAERERAERERAEREARNDENRIRRGRLVPRPAGGEPVDSCSPSDTRESSDEPITIIDIFGC